MLVSGGERMKNNKLNTFCKGLAALALVIANATLFRMGGAAGYNKLWRRLGCTLLSALLFIPHWTAMLCAMPFLALGYISYFNWFLRLFRGDQVNETWENFACQSMCIQASAYFLGWDLGSVMVWVGFSVLGCLSKILIDHSKLPKKDVLSELAFGGVMMLGLIVNIWFI